jgi:hypothetical protein
MFVVNTLSGERLEVKIERVATEELLHLSKEKYSFDWSLEIDYEVFKLFLIDNNEILGLISIERIPREWRLHVRLLSVSLPNIGKEKVFNGIVDNILDYVATMAINDFGQLACVSLRPKSELAEHYMNKYGLTVTGLFLSIEFPDILQLQNNNDYD